MNTEYIQFDFFLVSYRTYYRKKVCGSLALVVYDTLESRELRT